MCSKKLRRIPQAKRQKVSIACDGCKKRKFKCSGTKPCVWCFRKGYECTYTVIDKRSLKGQRLAEQKHQQLQAQQPSDIKPEPSVVRVPSITEAIKPSQLQPSLAALATLQLPSPTCSPSALSKETASANGVFRIRANKFEYAGESGANSLLNEINHFSHCLHNMPLPPFSAEKPFKVFAHDSVAEIPKRQELDSILHHFDLAYNRIWNIIELEPFQQHIHKTLRAQTSKNTDYILLYLVLALGTDSDRSSQFFKSALLLLRNHFTTEIALWQVQCHYLIFFFYRHWGNSPLAYHHLGTAINFARLVDLHKHHQPSFYSTLYNSLFISDSLYSMVCGKPTCLTYISSGEDSQLLSLSLIVNRILNTFYIQQNFTVFKLKELSIELKSWSLNLSPDMYVTNVVKDYQLLNLHFVNLSAILLVSRPLFVYHIASYFDKALHHDTYAQVAKDYFICSLTCAVYTVQFIDTFRPYLHDIIHNLLLQSTQILYVGMLFLNRVGDNYGFDINYLVNSLSKSVGQIPPAYGDIISQAISKYTIVSYSPIDLVFLKHFQDHFVSQEIAPTFRKSYSTYDTYDSALLHKVSP